jgi:hypothetical protein
MKRTALARRKDRSFPRVCSNLRALFPDREHGSVSLSVKWLAAIPLVQLPVNRITSYCVCSV